MCLYPKLIKNRKYIANKKNGGIIPAVSDNRVLMVPVGCGKCIECKKQKSREWQVRLQEEIRNNTNGKFITLTFSNESIIELTEDSKLEGYNLDNEIATKGVRRFLERWRKKYKKSIRHWLVTEIGGNNTERIHIHGIIWTNELEEISKIWKYGIITIGERKYYKGKEMNKNSIGYVNEKTINYIVKYVNKIDQKHKEYNSKILCSHGIGNNYTNRIDSKTNKYKDINTDETYKTRQGIKLAMPIYYRNKIYNEEEREKLWLQKLDKNVRWVCGEKVDISKGEEEYYKILEYYRVKNKRLGYGNNEKNWELKRYENERRNLKKLEILKNVGSKPQGYNKKKQN
jgi:hypothetical protein